MMHVCRASIREQTLCLLKMLLFWHGESGCKCMLLRKERLLVMDLLMRPVPARCPHDVRQPQPHRPQGQLCRGAPAGVSAGHDPIPLHLPDSQHMEIMLHHDPLQ